MVDILLGPSTDRLPAPRAAAKLPFLELSLRAPLPSFATLARFKKQCRSAPKLALVCPRSSWMTPRGPMREGAELDAGIEWLSRVVDILDVSALVVATGNELTTGERDKTLFAGFLDRLRPTGRLLVAAPRGLWEAEHGDAFARAAGCVYAFDPLEEPPPAGEIAYGRIRPKGARPRLSEGHLHQIAQRVTAAECRKLFVSIESATAARDAGRLRTALNLAAELETLEDDEPASSDAPEPDTVSRLDD